MSTFARTLRALTLAIPLAAVVASAGCGNNVGDGCASNIDCSPFGDRFCDTSTPGGYCTIDGCDVGTCPSEAVCVRFFTQILNEPCDFSKPFPDNGCLASERCICDALGADNSCGSAHCAPESTEHRWCQRRCDTTDNCRPQYSCVSTGTNGAEAVPTADMLSPAPVKFCAPNPNGT